MIAGDNGLQCNSAWLALVAYVPDPLGRFLDKLRKALTPSYRPRAHVSILPPRLVGVPHESVAARLRSIVPSFAAFDVEATEIEVFPETSVIYLEIGAGNQELRRMHRTLNTGDLAYDEPFEYHPHITLAQDLLPGQAAALLEKARLEWSRSRLPRRFSVQGATLLTSANPNRWKDLEIISLNASPAAR